jgi:radical SAM-linked protein
LENRHRYRITFGKNGALRFTSHLDLARIWERALRRAGTPLVYSQGFNPRPRIQLAAALPLGYASTGELLDAWLETRLADPEEFLTRLSATVPEGLHIQKIEEVPLKGPSLQSVTRYARYHVQIGESIDRDAINARISTVMAREAIWHERRGKTLDIRPLIYALETVPDEPGVVLMSLALSQEHGTLRPDDVLDELGVDPLKAYVTRVTICFEEPRSKAPNNC